jgi:hypothetical protein
LLVFAVVLGGCDGVFKLVELPPVADADVTDQAQAQACRYATIAADEPGQDEDGDTVINSMDSCPTVADNTEHDEDHDGTPDPCDPCPMLAAAGDDAECDLIGAACDPDEGVAQVQTFHGFGDASAFVLYEVMVIDDRATGPTNAAGGDILTSTAVTPIGRYEISGHVRQVDENYRSIDIQLEDVGAGSHYELELGLEAGYWSLSITKDNVVQNDPLTGPAKSEHGPPGMTEVAYRLVVDYDGTRLTVTLAGDLNDTVSTAAVLGNVRYGASFYHDVPRSDIEVDWLRRVAPE